MIEITCLEVWREVSNYIEGDVDPELRARIERHVKSCRHCRAVLDGAGNIVRLLSGGEVIELPSGFSERLRRRIPLTRRAVPKKNAIDFGITQQEVPLGSHVIYFWETDAEFRRGMRFLEVGLDASEHCVVFGDEESNARVLSVLKGNGYAVDSLMKCGTMVFLNREHVASGTLAAMQSAFEAAERNGTPAIRFLGNLTVAQEKWPGSGEIDVLELEARVTVLARQFRCVMLCMYDMGTLSASMILKGGFQTHPLAMVGDCLCQNPYYVPEQEFLAALPLGLGDQR